MTDQNGQKSASAQLIINKIPDQNEPSVKRFQTELEFVQCLANPWYLNWLAQQGYFQDAAFINYLSYLRYWKQPEYAKFIIYPHALHFLDLLQHPSFRDAVAKKDVIMNIHQMQYYHWMYYRNPPKKQLEEAIAMEGVVESNGISGE